MSDEVDRYTPKLPIASNRTGEVTPLAKAGDLARGPETHLGRQVELITVDREALWLQLPEPVRARLLARAGKPFHSWLWVSEDPSRPRHSRGYVLGPGGFFKAHARLQHDGRIVHPISGFQIDPNSLRYKTVTGRPARWNSESASTEEGIGSSSSSSRIPGLTDITSLLLGQLPLEAQTLLQAPFLAGEQLLAQHSDYGYEDRATRRQVVIVLAGTRTLTCVIGIGDMPSDDAEQFTHWTLTCRRAAVTQRVGV